MTTKKEVHLNQQKLLAEIVANTDPKNYRGRWVFFDMTSKELKDNDFSNWENLEL